MMTDVYVSFGTFADQVSVIVYVLQREYIQLLNIDIGEMALVVRVNRTEEVIGLVYVMAVLLFDYAS